MLLRATFTLFILSGIAHSLLSQEFRINNFGPNNYKASPNNYSGFEAADGFWYFANENGVLQYDGSRWELITISNYSSVHSLAQQPENLNRVYVGGNNEFGYLEKDSVSGNFEYHSLRTDSLGQLSEIWNIITLNGDVYFECREKIIKYNGERIVTFDVSNAYLFLIGDELFASIYDQGLGTITDEGVTLFNSEFSFDKDAAFYSLKTLEKPDSINKNLLITSFNGLYTYNKFTNEVNKWVTEIDELLRTVGVADAIVWRDSLYAITTRSSGLIFLDGQGNVQKVLGEDATSSNTTDQIPTLFDELDPKVEGLINEENGLPSNQLRSLFQDIRGNIWICSLYGMSHLTWDIDYNSKDYVPKTILREALLNTSDTVNSRSIEFLFATPGYERSDVEYSFYLEGFEETWLPWTDQVEKEYTNLDGGIYKFHVKARIDDASETTEVIYPFAVPTLWFKNVWTYLFGASILSVLVFFGLRYRTVRLKSLNRRLEAIIENRTKELILQREQLKGTNEELTIINTELDNFVYRSSHDLVAPLKSIRGLVNVAKKDDPPKNQMMYLSMMEKSVLKLEDFIKSIMEYSTNAKKAVNLSSVSLNTVVDDVLDELKFYDNVNQITLVKEFDTSVKILSDLERLKIIMSNLITNGIKYHNYKKDRPTITVKLSEEDDSYVIEVIDNGHGIEPQHIDKIFEMFFRASDSSEGSGLGLYIVKDTIAKLGGSISVTSEQGIGSNFKVSVPKPDQS
ncbi:MAG: ATP-binding protein [Bacteroidota bacterium]